MYNTTMFLNVEIYILILKYVINRPNQISSYYFKNTNPFLLKNKFITDMFNYESLISKNCIFQVRKKFELVRDIYFFV